MNEAMEHVPNVRRRSRWLLWLGLLIGLPVLGVVVFEWTSRQAWQRALQAARDDPYPATYAELEARRQQWPADQNAATVFLALQARLEEQDQEARREAAPVVPLYGKGMWPALGRLPPPEQAHLLDGYLNDRAGLLAEIDRYKDFHGASLPLMVVAENPFETFFPELASLRYSARLKALHLVHKAAAGDTDHLVRDVTVLLRHGEMVADHPTLISALVSIACDDLAVSTIERAMALGIPAAGQLQALMGMLDDTRPEKALNSRMVSERVFFIVTAEYLRKGNTAAEITGFANIPIRGALLHRDLAFGLRLQNRRAAGGEDLEARLALEQEIGVIRQTIPAYYLVSNIFIGDLTRVCELALRTVAGIRAARAGLAVEWYRQAQGDFPEGLDDLVPEYLGAVPEDPFDRKPLRYLVTPESAIVYSISMNRIDDGGDLEGCEDAGPGDVGFRVLRPEFRRLPPLPEEEPAGQDAESAVP